MRTILTIVSNFKSSFKVSNRLFLRALKSEYVDLKFGVAWNFAEPISLVVIFSILRSGNFMSTDHFEIPFTLYLVTGLLPFQIFYSSIQRAITSLQEYQDIISKISLPPETFFTTTFLRNMFDACISTIVISAFYTFYLDFSLLNHLIAFLVFASIVLLGISIGFILAPLNSIYSDFLRAVNLSSRPLLFLSPIFYSESTDTLVYQVNQFNPIRHFLHYYRSSLFPQDTFSYQGLLLYLLIIFVVFFASTVFFHRAFAAINKS